MATSDMSGGPGTAPVSGSDASGGATLANSPRLVVPPAQGRRAMDLRPFLHADDGTSPSPNPFVNAPPGMRAYLHSAEIAATLQALPQRSVLISVVGGVCDSELHAAVHDAFLSAPEEELITNTRLISFAPEKRAVGEVRTRLGQSSFLRLVVNDDRRFGVVRLPSTVNDPQVMADIGKVAVDLQAAALELLGGMGGDRARNVRNVSAGLRTPRNAEDAYAVVGDLLDLLEVVASEPEWNRRLVLRFAEAEMLTASQHAFLGQVMTEAAKRAPSVRFMVSGFPGAVANIECHLAPSHGFDVIDLGWTVPSSAWGPIEDYLVATTAHSSVPFSLSAAEEIVRSSSGVKPLVDRIGRASWQRTYEEQQLWLDKPMSEVDHMRSIDIAGEQVAKRDVARYEVLREHRNDLCVQYVAALSELTIRTGRPLHCHEAIIDMMVELYVPGASTMGPGQRSNAREDLREAMSTESRTTLRQQGLTTRDEQGRVGLADPQFGAVIRTLGAPEAQR